MAADHDTSLEARIIELETRIAYQDRLLDALDEVVRDFAARVEALERRLGILQAGALDPVAPSEPPPHY